MTVPGDQARTDQERSGRTVELLDISRPLVRARSHGFCEGCGSHAPLDVHHRQARGAGGVHGLAVKVANDLRNLLALCRVCHDMTESADEWEECLALGWRIPHVAGLDPREVPALLWTAQGHAWWQLTEDAGYQWIDWGRHQRLSSGALRSRPWRQPLYTPTPIELVSETWAD
jgi:hypothetical protein